MTHQILEHINEIVNHGAYDLTERVREETIKLSKRRKDSGIKAFLYSALVVLLTFTTPSTSSYFTNINSLEQNFLKPTQLYSEPAGPKPEIKLGVKPKNKRDKSLDVRLYNIYESNFANDPNINRYNPNMGRLILRESRRQSIDFIEYAAIAQKESSFNPLAVSDAGAVGISQLMPETALDYGLKNIYRLEDFIEAQRKYKDKKISKEEKNKAKEELNAFLSQYTNELRDISERPDALSYDDRFDPGQSIKAGISHYKILNNIFNGDQTLSLAGYNAGHFTVQKWLEPKWNGKPEWDGKPSSIPYEETKNFVSIVKDNENLLRTNMGLP